jgi:tripartite-type tricarboxylate transporter receptor subunit TctC
MEKFLMIRHLSATLGLTLAALATGGAVQAQTFPAHEIQLIVPFPAGGGVDMTARRVAEGLTKVLGQPVIVENRPGANSLVGAEAVRNAAPDGYTLLMASSAFVTNVVVGDQQPYDPLVDFAPVTMVTNAPNILVAGTPTGLADVAGLTAKASEQPDYLRYASYGDRSAPDLAMQLFTAAAGVKLQHIPYGGGAPALTAVLSGETDVLFSSVLPVLSQLEAGALTPIAIASAERLEVLPDVPTFHEAGLDFEIGTWFGIVAPAGTPAETVATIDEAIRQVLATPEFTDAVTAEGSQVLGLDAAAFAARLAEEVAFWDAFEPAPAAAQ